ncbi:hypothetical protein RBG61_05940 [Paludicola sp. MB14-C6]|uniref:HAAS signaling domain-containing protein n=1 Tax=Paludihabitans sp. MB14-C6 TaxID=3070656 RepID=UPI0027DE0D55|nr:hypothetical protein [Paludicola sp. MB14-C6]WMJ24205.1 hypothetical protein RBG61_05940 [Paludicola sp. MB14-C6]
MTLQDKTVNKYSNDIKKNLKVSLKMKTRIMNDLNADINARREAGETIDEIIADMGTPQEVANGFNSELADCESKGSTWRYVFLGLAILSAICFVLSVVSYLIQTPYTIGSMTKNETSAFVAQVNHRVPFWVTLPFSIGCLMEYFLLKWKNCGTKKHYGLIAIMSVAAILFFVGDLIRWSISYYIELESTMHVTKGNLRIDSIMSAVKSLLYPGFWLPIITLIVSIRQRKIDISQKL